MNRKHVAIMFNDIQGYTALMQENESYAIALRRRHKEVTDRLTQDHQGTIIQYYGDGTLSIFDNTADAVRCAISMQLEFAKSPAVPLRIGINAGEIILTPEGVYGDSVNIASRIERMSVPGSVLISDVVYREIKSDSDIETRELGRFELKNVRHPMTIHAVVRDGLRIPEPSELAGKIGFKEKSVLVLPFYNLGLDRENEFFSDGITEQIIYALSAVEGLKVASRTSSFSFKDKEVNLKQVHREWGIDYILEGSVRSHGRKVRITSQLIHAADDFHLWTETYDRELSDVFQVQDEISAKISNRLKASFQHTTPPPVKPAADDRPRQPEVFEHYHKGRYAWKQMMPGYIDESIFYFKKATETDKNFFPAWPALARAYAYKGYYNLMLPAEAAALCAACVREAERLDARHIRTHAASALYHFLYTHHWDELERHLHFAGDYAEKDNFILYNAVLQTAGMYNIATGHFAAGIQQLRKATMMDPLNLSIQTELARGYSWSGEHRKALDLVEQMIHNRPDYLPAHESRGWILFAMGQQRQAIDAFEYYRHHSLLPIAGLTGLAYAYSRTSQTAKAEEVRDLIVSVAQDIPSYLPHYDMALAHLGAQQYSSMFECLNAAANAGMPALIWIGANPLWDEIRRFKEYKALAERIYGTQLRPAL